MSVGAADVHKAIYQTWSAAGLDNTVTAYWDSSDVGKYTALNEGVAAPGTPHPYVVYEVSRPVIRSRQSASGSSKRYETDHELRFQVYARPSGSSSAKEVAATVVEELLKTFGGHPTQSPSSLTLDNGNMLLVRYQGDYSTRVDEQVWEWTLEYVVKVDVPVRV